MMEKITLNLEAVEADTFKFGGNKIEVIPTISIEDQVQFIRHYLGNYFNATELIPGTSTSYFTAEYSLAFEVLDKYTNVKVFEESDLESAEDNIVVVSTDNNILISQGLWKEGSSRITNYPEFRQNLDRVVQDKKEELALEKSVGVMIDGLVTKVTDFIERLASINIDDEGLSRLKETAKELMSNIEQSPVAEIYKESSKQVQLDTVAKTTRKPRKSKKAE
jgi:hypothetical protein